MRSLSFLVLALLYHLPLVVADRTSNAHNTPTVCNTEPIATGTAVAQKRVRRERDGRAHAETLRNALSGRDLSKRSGMVTYDANCDNAPPTSSGYKPSNGFATMKSVLQQAYTDAVALADAAASIGENNLAFTHYFGGDQTDDQYTHFKNMMSAVKGDTSQYFSIQFECSGSVSVCTGSNSVAVTDASVGAPNDEKIINICTPFWTAASTRFLLYDPSKEGGVPYRDNSTSGWCNKDNQGNSRRNCQFYATAGETILHELTHLDSLSTQAGLLAPTEGNDIGRHGTDDAQTGCELLGARDLLRNYQADNNLTRPDYNAESYAAAATELYFMNLCSISEIRPLVVAQAASAVPTPASSTPTPTSVAPHPAYATGTCSFHLREWQDCADDSQNLFAIVNMVDNDKNDIGDTETDPPNNTLGDPINTSDPYSFTSKLPLPLVIVGEHENDYVQFTYGSLSWTSRTTSGPATCSIGGWNPTDGPVCGSRTGNTNAENQMDCSFPC